jgi:hypothetical protein
MNGSKSLDVNSGSTVMSCDDVDEGRVIIGIGKCGRCL